MELKVGQEVVFRNNRSKKYVKTTISKVGRKYFYIEGYSDLKFHMSSGLYAGVMYGHGPGTVYLDVSKKEKEVALQKAIAAIQKELDSIQRDKLTEYLNPEIRCILDKLNLDSDSILDDPLNLNAN